MEIWNRTAAITKKMSFAARINSLKTLWRLEDLEADSKIQLLESFTWTASDLKSFFMIMIKIFMLFHFQGQQAWSGKKIFSISKTVKSRTNITDEQDILFWKMQARTRSQRRKWKYFFVCDKVFSRNHQSQRKWLQGKNDATDECEKNIIFLSSVKKQILDLIWKSLYLGLRPR